MRRGNNGKHKRPNALSHGAFAATAILPGEDPQEFAMLYLDLIEEWSPDGPSECDAVHSLAVNMWRKARIQKFIQAKAEGCSYDPDHQCFNETRALHEFYYSVKDAPEQFEKLLHVLALSHADHLRQKCPPADCESTVAWQKALKKEILMLVATCLTPPVQFLLDGSAKIVPPDAFAHEIALEERIEAMIDRSFKRLIQLKAMKQMLAKAE